MATPEQIRKKIEAGLITRCQIAKFPDGYSCSFTYTAGRKPAVLYPSTKKHPVRTWLTISEVMTYLDTNIGWTGPLFDRNYNQIR